MHRVYALLSIILVASCQAAEFKPDLEHCTLEVGGFTLMPVKVNGEYQKEYRVGQQGYLVRGETITSPKSTGDDGWTAKSEDGRRLYWISASASTGFLLGYELDDKGQFKGYDAPIRIRRLDLKTGKWMPDLPIASMADERFVAKGIVDALAVEHLVIVLISLGKKDQKDAEEGGPVAYQVMAISPTDKKPLWSRTFEAEGGRPYTGGYVWGIPAPEYAYSAIRHLSLMGEDLLVCAEEMQPIRCLTCDTGRELWQVERLWEFQRGFIGPSVWSHFIGRFGVDEFSVADKKALKEDFDKHYACALLAGPITIPIAFDRENDTHSIFIAITKGPAKGYSGYLSESIVYELNNSGKPISMASLPQTIDGSGIGIAKDGVVWRCRNNTFVKVAPALRSPVVQMGGGGADGLSRVTWLRQISYHAPDAWLLTGKAGDPVAFGKAHAFWVPAGGHILKEGDQVYRFPIASIDLQEGKETEMLLSVPFSGKVRLPDKNISTENLPDGSTSHRTWSSLGLAVTALEAHEGFLDVTLGMEKQAATMRFDLREVSALRVGEGAGPDPKEAGRKRAAAIKKEDRNEALRSACHGTDISFVRALLDAGADPKDRSKYGWSALMVAACYGTAEMVDVLIKAGSDVSIHDKNCGGQTVLMWAARGNREHKQKVKLLLDAGADPNATSEDGYTPLMSASGEGGISTVELLLSRGANVNAKNKKGETALDLAKASHEAGARIVIEILEAAKRK